MQRSSRPPKLPLDWSSTGKRMGGKTIVGENSVRTQDATPIPVLARRGFLDTLSRQQTSHHSVRITKFPAAVANPPSQANDNNTYTSCHIITRTKMYPSKLYVASIKTQAASHMNTWYPVRKRLLLPALIRIERSAAHETYKSKGKHAE